MIGSTDDDLLFELRKETAEQKMGKEEKKIDIDAIIKSLDVTKSLLKEGPKNAAEDLKAKQDQQLKSFPVSHPAEQNAPVQHQKTTGQNHQSKGPESKKM